MSEHLQVQESSENLSPVENMTPEQEAQRCLAQIREHAALTEDPESIVGLQDQYRELHNTMNHMEQERVAVCAEREGFRYEMDAALLPPESTEIQSETLGALESLCDEYFSILEIPGGDTQAGLQNMYDYFATLTESSQQEFLILFQELIEDEFSLMDLEDYFMDNGFINSETIGIFQVAGFGDIDIVESIEEADASAEEADASAEEADASAEEANIGTMTLSHYVDNIKDIISWMNNGTIDSELQGIYADFNLISEDSDTYAQDVIDHSERISNYFAELASQPEEFARVLDSIGGSENSELYQRVRTQVLSIPSSSGVLRQAFDRYENRENPEITPNPMPNLEIPGDLTNDMNARAGQGQHLSETYDHSTNPPRRTLSLGDSDYQMDADLPVGEYYPATVEYTNSVHEITTEINSIMAVIEYVENIPDDTNITEVITFIEANIDATLLSEVLMISGVNSLSSFSSVSSLRNALVGPLGKKKQELENELETARQEYEISKQEADEAYREFLAERQEAQKEILVFLSQCGFDMIPKPITDMLIAEINRDFKGLDLGGGTILAQSIDIKNGRLGDERSDGNERFELGDKEKEGFIRLVNVMTTGRSEGEGAIVQNPADAVAMNIPVVDTQVNSLLEQNGVKSMATGSWNINEMRRHLENYKSNQDTQNPHTR